MFNEDKEKEKIYIRDGRAPIPLKEATSRVMSANKGKNTRPEILLRKSLNVSGVRHYRLHYNKLPGSPDIAIPRAKLAIFVNGCYWHRCPHCKPSMPKSNVEFWKNKFKKNKARDTKKRSQLEKMGWKVVVVWECQIKDDHHRIANMINNLVKSDDSTLPTTDKQSQDV